MAGVVTDAGTSEVYPLAVLVQTASAAALQTFAAAMKASVPAVRLAYTHNRRSELMRGAAGRP